MKYQSEQELIADGFNLSPQTIHDGKGIGKLYEKIVDNVRVYFVVEADGEINLLHSKVGVIENSGDEPKVSEEDKIKKAIKKIKNANVE